MREQPLQEAADDQFWTIRFDDRSWFRRPDTPSGLLVVFVHGFEGTALGTWGDLPKWVLDALEHDAAILSYGYPTRMLEEASIDQAAQDLRTLIETIDANHANCEHIAYVTHSTGGLVVKELMRSCSSIGPSNAVSSMPDRATINARRIINIAVPHRGASVPASLGLIPQYIVNAVLRVVLSIVSQRGSGPNRNSRGRNRLLAQLMCWHPWARRLERNHVRAMRHLDARGFPRPVSIELLASNDPIIRKYQNAHNELTRADDFTARSDLRVTTLRGTHVSVKLPTSPTEPLVHLITREIGVFQPSPDLAVATHTMARSLSIEQRFELHQLQMPVRAEGDELEPMLRDVRSLTQEEVLQELRSCALDDSRLGPRTVVVTGDAGVGKSVVIRRFARALCARAQQRDVHEEPLPIVIPLQQIGKEVRAQVTWQFISEYWCTWATGVVADQGGLGPDISTEWLNDRIRQRPTVIILDGVDEFLALQNERALSITRLARELESIGTANHRLLIVLGVRCTQPAVKRMCRTPSHDILEVCRLTPRQAEKLFEGSKERLAAIKNPELRRLLLSPLILTHIGPNVKGIPKERLESYSGVLETALEAIVDRSMSQPAQEVEQREPIDTSDVMTALSIAAWHTFSLLHGSLNTDEFDGYLDRLEQRWTSEGAKVLSEPVLRAIRLCRRSDAAALIMHRTVLLNLGESAYRFVHKEWEEYLASRYVADCVLASVVDEFGMRAMLNKTFMLCGERLEREAESEIGPAYMQSVTELYEQSKNELVVANSAAIIGNTRAAVEPQVVESLLQLAQTMPAVARHVTLNTLCFRALRNHERDQSAHAIRRSVLPRLSGFYAEDGHPVTARLAWCFHDAFARSFEEIPPPDRSLWRGCRLRDDEADEALAMVVTDVDASELNGRDRSLQIAFARILFAAETDKHKTLSAIFFLYPLIEAARQSKLAFEAEVLVQRFLSSESEAAEIVEGYDESPLARKIYEEMRAIFKSLPGGGVGEGSGQW